ncbi:hypothetical protein FA10DRAFT_194260 [Acaromyces ingoldii]|uniref:Uncharacterized protein n=1 Tax=Acaromyces ingoldii TaxID=215250 RepID=A0A316YC70_9BASI|nr:hypothetical protein FA10DRAFT_194260 [Acaromyces ingoldii]PWN87087.1 hypothetical protein FA10DRAFT_194260 [Acaromyces ingoldii]
MMRPLTLSLPFASHKSRPTAHKKTKHQAEGSRQALAALTQEIIDADEGALAARPRRGSGQPLKSRRTMALRRSAGFDSWLSASRSMAERLRSRPSGIRAAIHNMPFSSTTRCVSHGRPLRLSPSHLSVIYLPSIWQSAAHQYMRILIDERHEPTIGESAFADEVSASHRERVRFRRGLMSGWDI